MRVFSSVLPVRFLSLALILVACPWLSVRAATPAEELLRFVPADVGFCVITQDLRGHSARLLASPFLEQLLNSPTGQALAASNEIKQLSKLEKQLATQFKLDWTQLRDDVFGDAVVLAYRPGPPDKPEQEQGLILIRARNPRVLADLLERLNQMLKNAGVLKELEQREHEGVKYWRRLEQGEESFYYLRGPILLLTSQEPMLRQAISQERKLSADQAGPLTRRVRLAPPEKGLLQFWLNPRAFDAGLDGQVKRATATDAAFLKTFAQCWKALEDVLFTLTLQKDLEVRVTLRAQPEKLPLAVRQFLKGSSEAGELWGRFPDNPLFAVGARTDPAALVRMLALFQSEESFQAFQEELNRGLGAALGKNVVTEVLPHLGPDWGLCVSSPPDKNWFPSIVLAIRARAGDPAAPVDRSLLEMIHSYAVVAALSFNRQGKERMTLKTIRHEKLEIRYLETTGRLPRGFQPAYGAHGGYLILASSPEVLRRFATTPPAPFSKKEIPLLRLSFKEWRRYLKDHREGLAAMIASQQHTEVKEAEARLDGLLTVLQFLDRLEVSQRSEQGEVSFLMRLRPSAALAR